MTMKPLAAMTVTEADALLTRPGGFFGLNRETVNGVDMDVIANRYQNLRSLLSASAGHGGDGSARYYVFDDGRAATFADNLQHAAAIAAALRQTYGVSHGDRVALLGSNQPAWIQSFWGTVSLGAIAVALNGWWKGDEIRYGLELTQPKVLIADRHRLRRLEDNGQSLDIPVIVMDDEDDEFGSLLQRYAHAPLPDDRIAVINEDDPAAVLFTSGTTGRPKGAIQTHRNFGAYISCVFMIGARDAVRFPCGHTKPSTETDPKAGAKADTKSDTKADTETDSKPDAETYTEADTETDTKTDTEADTDADTKQQPAIPGPTLAASPLFHVSGLHACAVTAMATSLGHVWTTGRFDPEKVFRLTERHRISRWSGVTTQVWRLIEHPRLHHYDISSVTSVGGGGSVWSPELQRSCRAALPDVEMTVSVGYGLTECSGLASSAPDDVLREHPDCVGFPLPTASVSIRNDNDEPLPDGTVGNVSVRGPMVMPGYWNDPQATKAVIRPGGWLRTGDHGYLRDGLLFLSGRRGDLIIRGGENIYPAEIENRLDAHPEVSESAVFGVEHREFGQEVKAVVVTQPGTQTQGPVSEEELSEWVAATLADFKVPAHWELRTEPLPRNATGKVLKQVVAGLAESDFIEE